MSRAHSKLDPGPELEALQNLSWLGVSVSATHRAVPWSQHCVIRPSWSRLP